MMSCFNNCLSLCCRSLWSLLLLTTVAANAQLLTFEQAQVVSGAGLNEGFTIAFATAADAQGNVYVTGHFGGTQRFGNVTLLATTIPPALGFDIYVAKMDPSGQVLWAVRGGGISDDFCYDIALDGRGNVYITGSFLGRTARYGTTTLQSNRNGNGSSFIAKLAASTGQWQWAVGVPDDGEAAFSELAVDRRGNVWAAGGFQQGATRLGPFTLSGNGDADILVAKLDPAGNWLWAVAVGGAGTEAATAIALDEEGNGYVTGSFSSPRLAFGSHVLVKSQPPPNFNSNAFVAKIDSAGSWQWVTGAGGVGISRSLGIATDKQHRVFITGSFTQAADFGSVALTSQGDHDVFTACLSQSGNWQWAAAGGGAEEDIGISIAADGTGYVYVGGRFYLRQSSSVAQFGNTTLRSAGVSDAFVVRLDSVGNYRGVVAGGGILEDNCTGVRAVGNKIYLTGNISSSINVSPNAQFGRYTLAANPTTYGRMYSAWVAKMIVPSRGTQLPGVGGDAGINDLSGWDARANLPNVITPNNDGYNDFFAPKFFPAGPWQLTVYNRWGTRTYSFSDYQSDWGPDAAPGVYYYLLRHQATNRTYKGWVEVIK